MGPRRGRLVVDTPHTAALAGWSGGEPARAEAITIEVDNDYGVIAASAPGKEPIAASRRLLVTAVARVEPTGYAWVDESRRDVADPGRPPLLREPVKGSVEWRRAGSIKAYALDAEGNRAGEASLVKTADGARLAIDGKAGGDALGAGPRGLRVAEACGRSSPEARGSSDRPSSTASWPTADEVVALDNFDPFYARPIKRANLAARPRQPAIPARRGRHPRPRSRSLRVVSEIAARRHRPPRGQGRRPAEHRGRRRSMPRSTSLGTIHLLEAACRLEPLPRFVYASSSSVYGDRPDAPFRETDPVDHPISPYAATKKACELLAHTFHHLHGLPVTGLRFFTAYRPAQPPRPGDRQVRPR